MKKRSMSGVGFAAMLVAMWLMQGCEMEDCPSLYCEPSVAVSIEPPLEQEGTYEFILRPTASEAATCTAIVDPSGAGARCDGAHADHFVLFSTSSGGIRSISLRGAAPASFDFVIRRDGEVLSRTTHWPSYSTPEASCLSSCKRASVQVNL